MKTPLRVHGPAALSNSAATKYTVPANSKFVIRKIHVYNPGSGSVNFTMSIGTDAAGTRIFDAVPVLEDVPFNEYGPYTLEETEIIQALGSVNNQATLTIEGDLYTLG